MTTRLAIASILSASLFTMAACQATSPADLPPGKYEKSTESVDKYGTKRAVTTNTTVLQDRYGNKTAIVEQEVEKDPRGLFNKTSSESTTVVKERY